MTPTLEEFKAGLQRERIRRNKERERYERSIDDMFAKRTMDALLKSKKYWNWRAKG